MNLWPRLRAAWAVAIGDQAALERKDLGVLEDLLAMYGGSKSGVAVDWRTALQVSTMIGCARVIAEGLAQVPLKLMRYDPASKKREEARDHPLYDVLSSRANQWQTSFEFRETIGLHASMRGNAYVFKNVVGDVIKELIPLEPQRMEAKCDQFGTLTYALTAANGAQQTFPAETIWHIRGPSWSGWQGMDTVYLAREALGLSIVTEEAHARLHSNGAQTSGTYSVDGKLDDKQHQQLVDWIERNHVGPKNASRPMVLDRGAKWMATSMTGVDAQHLETRRYQIEEVCRFMRVMPIMVGYSDKTATYASAEQMFLAHVVYTMSPWYERIEQSVDANLLSDKDRAEGLYSNFVEEGLMRASAKDTKDMILGYVNGGLMTPNEGRAKLDLNPDDDPASDELRIPVNVADAPEPADPSAEPNSPPKPAPAPRKPALAAIA